MTRAPRTELIRLRESAGMTRAVFAKKIGVSVPSVCRVETGARDPSLAVLRRWLDALGPEARLDLFFQQDAA